MEALTNNPKTLKKVFLASNFVDTELGALVKKNGIPIAVLSSGSIPWDVDRGDIRQGIIGLLSLENLVSPFRSFIGSLKISSDISLVLLDEIQDPHNLGAIIRSAAAFGVSGVLIPERNQVPITSAVIKVSAGMAFRVPLVSIGNVNATLRDLKDKGFWIYGLDETATKSAALEKFDRPSVFVMGNEAAGIREKTRELCDVLLSIPMNARCESLNVAASAAITFYSWSLQHKSVFE